MGQSFAPAGAIVKPKTTTTISNTQIQFKEKDRDAIAHELIEIVPGEHKAKITKDYSPWKRIMELEHAEDQAQVMRKKLEIQRTQLLETKAETENLEREVRDLHLQLPLTASVVNQRFKNFVGRNVDRFLRLVHLYHEVGASDDENVEEDNAVVSKARSSIEFGCYSEDEEQEVE